MNADLEYEYSLPIVGAIYTQLLRIGFDGTIAVGGTYRAIMTVERRSYPGNGLYDKEVYLTIGGSRSGSNLNKPDQWPTASNSTALYTLSSTLTSSQINDSGLGIEFSGSGQFFPEPNFKIDQMYVDLELLTHYTPANAMSQLASIHYNGFPIGGR
jgi:hypothetical protein